MTDEITKEMAAYEKSLSRQRQNLNEQYTDAMNWLVRDIADYTDGIVHIEQAISHITAHLDTLQRLAQRNAEIDGKFEAVAAAHAIINL